MIQILLVEDNPADARLVHEMLVDAENIDFNLHTVSRLSKAMEFAEGNSPDVILLDLGLPDSSGIDTFLALHKVLLNIPIIVLTGLHDELLGIEAAKVGAQDYLVKGEVQSELLARSIGYSIERTKVDVALRESEGQYRDLVETSTDAIISTDENMKILVWNKAAELMFGYPAEEALGKVPSDLIVPDDYLARHRSGIERFLTTEQPHIIGTTVEYEARRSDGSVFPAELSLSGRKGPNGWCFTNVIRDVTERRNALKALDEKDRSIRKAYVDVLSAVTGGKLVILAPEELDSHLGEPVIEPKRYTSFAELAQSRRDLRDIQERHFPHLESSSQMILGCGEAITNAIKHGGSCEIQVYNLNNRMQIRVSDEGSGIDFSDLPKATLHFGFSTKKSLGAGFTVMLDVALRILLVTEPEGTTLVLEICDDEVTEQLDEILTRLA